MSPSARRVARLLTTARDHLSRSDAVVVARIEDALPALATARALTDRFIAMVRSGSADTLHEWLIETEASAIAYFASGLRANQAAVAAALAWPWSNGQPEGQINRLKTLKRQMYGRANINLLKARMIQEAHPRHTG